MLSFYQHKHPLTLLETRNRLTDNNQLIIDAKVFWDFFFKTKFKSKTKVFVLEVFRDQNFVLEDNITTSSATQSRTGCVSSAAV